MDSMQKRGIIRGYKTVINTTEDENGVTSIIEIMDKLFYYNYICMKPEKRAQYIQETIERNMV